MVEDERKSVAEGAWDQCCGTRREEGQGHHGLNHGRGFVILIKKIPRFFENVGAYFSCSSKTSLEPLSTVLRGLEDFEDTDFESAVSRPSEIILPTSTPLSQENAPRVVPSPAIENTPVKPRRSPMALLPFPSKPRRPRVPPHPSHALHPGSFLISRGQPQPDVRCFCETQQGW